MMSNGMEAKTMSSPVVISLGGGWQSSAIYIMSATGVLPIVDFAVFADTGAESRGPSGTYAWLWRLAEEFGDTIPIIVGSAGDIIADGVRSAVDGVRYSNPPLYGTPGPGSARPMMNRKCTRDYKLSVIKRTIREQLGRSRSLHVEMWIGITTDEAHRMRPADVGWITNRWPLVEMGMRASDCLLWLRERGYEVPRSCCVMCPYQGTDRWRWLRKTPDSGWDQAVEYDEAIRAGVDGTAYAPLYVHRNKRPLAEVEMDDGQLDVFGNECAGVCGV